MPCYDERSSGSYIEEHEVQPLKKKLRALKQRLDAATRAACEFGRIATRQHVTRITPESLRWYERHCEEDARRKRRERAQKMAKR